MTTFLPKLYQQAVLDSVETYFRACLQLGDADTAFYQTTRELWGEGSKYQAIAGFSSDMPYFCLRVPTGGGKTWLAAKSVALINTHLLRCEHSVILWLVTARFIADMQRDLGLAYRPDNWDAVKLAAWLCRNLPEPSITHASKQAFVAHWISALFARPGYDLGRANRQKFLIRNLLERRIKDLRSAAVKQAYQQTLFGDGRETRVVVDERHCFEYHPQGYAPSRDYDGRFGQFTFQKHYYGRIGDFDSGEEFACACWLDTQAQKGRISFWVRNLVRKEGCSFFLQKADGRFYPDFLCQLPDGTVLVVEYKGADRWKEAEDDRLIGGLWAELSGGRCRFVMIKDKQWQGIEAML